MKYTHPIKIYLLELYPYIGETRQREMTRLVYEIAKREKLDFKDIVNDMPEPDARFDEIKEYLIARRFPSTIAAGQKVKESFADVDINPDNRLALQKQADITPKEVYVEKAVKDCDVVNRIKNLYPDVPITIIDSYRDYRHKAKDQIDVYNNRQGKFFIIKEEFDFYKSCPCSSDSMHCGYHIVNLGQGCLFECTYCYLQEFLKKPGIMIPGNLDEFFEKFKGYDHKARIGSGEATDSLLFDHITGFSAQITNFFRGYPEAQFEFKTKSDNVDQLLSVPGAKNVVVSWSVNPQEVISSMEYYTASLDRRLKAAQECAEHGYSVAFHFDPMICYDGWQEGYKEVMQAIFDHVNEDQIAWISLGTLRMLPALKKVIENRFPHNSVLNAEMLTGFDGKIRYPRHIRNEMYHHMTQLARSYSSTVNFYLCMEDKEMCSTQTPQYSYSPQKKNIQELKKFRGKVNLNLDLNTLRKR